MAAQDVAVDSAQHVVAAADKNAHASRLDDSHRHLHRIVETSEDVAAAGAQLVALTAPQDVAYSTVGHDECHRLSPFMSEIISVRCHDDRTIALTRVGQDNVSGSVAPRYADSGSHYSIVQLVFEVTVNDAEVSAL